MKKSNWYSVKASLDGNGYGDISFHKEDGRVIVNMEGEELTFTVKEAKEIAEKIRKCANE